VSDRKAAENQAASRRIVLRASMKIFCTVRAGRVFSFVRHIHTQCLFSKLQKKARVLHCYSDQFERATTTDEVKQ